MTDRKGSSAAAGAAEDRQKDGGPAKVADDTAAELDRLRAELDRAHAELAQRGGNAPAPAPADKPEEMTHVAVLACGDAVKLPNPHTSHHHCEEHDATVPVTSVFALA